MNKYSLYRLAILAAALALPLRPASAEPTAKIELDVQGAQPKSLVLDKQHIPVKEGGGFRVFDAAAKRVIEFPKGELKADGDNVLFESSAPDLRLKAKFAPQGSLVLVTGEIESLNQEDRGFLVDYKIPFKADGATFSGDLLQNVTIKAGAPETESNVFPVGALATSDIGVALAIPPSDPRVFGLVADENGLTIRFYLGVTPKTKLFPSRASFSFLIYGVDPAWGFRSALSQYYKRFPDYYTPRLKKDGLYMFQMGGRTPPNVDQYGYDLFETQLPSFNDAIARNVKNSITTFPYMIVGQRELKFLPALPANYEEAMATYEKWTPAAHSTFALTKENACCLGDIDLKDEVDNSAVLLADGKYNIMVRNTLWGANSITFKVNPNPFLFEGEGRHTVGGDALALTDVWLKEHPEFGGMFIDSLGANWPAVLNYRADHFPYARYPLTVDPNGRIALDNALSHYEYINALRDKMRKSDRLLNGNGVYAYISKKGTNTNFGKQALDQKKNEFIAQAAPPELYRPGAKVSRFFLASLLDVASCEFGSKATVDQAQDCRVLLGPKQFSFLNYQWEDQAKVEEFVNKSLCFAIFASTTTNFFTGEQYENNPRGYLRDKELLDWYVPLVRLLSQSGWEPVREAKLTGENVYSERFGHGPTVYFSLYNDGTEKQTATLLFDLKGLGFERAPVNLKEIARQIPVKLGVDGSVAVTLEPKKTYVLALSSEAGVAAK